MHIGASTDSVAVALLSDYVFTWSNIHLADPSDMSHLELKAPKNIDQRGMLFERVLPILRES